MCGGTGWLRSFVHVGKGEVTMHRYKTASSRSVQNNVNVNSPVAISLIVQQSYGWWVEAVKENFGPRLGTLVAEKTVYDLGDWSL